MSDRLFFDTNILLDHLLCREPFADDAMALWSLTERRAVMGLISATPFDFVYYVVRHEADERSVRKAVRGLRDLFEVVFEVVEVDAQIINQAIDGGFTDFEGGIRHARAIRGRATHVLTRDPAGFRRSEVPVLSPAIDLHDQGPNVPSTGTAGPNGSVPRRL